MGDECVAQGIPLALLDQLHDVGLDSDRVETAAEPDTIGQSLDVRVHDDCLSAERVRKDNVCCLTSHARQGCQEVHVRHERAVPLFAQVPGLGDNRPRFVVIEASRLDNLLYLEDICVAEGAGRRIRGKQPWCHLVDSGVGALCAEDGSCQQLPRIMKLECRASDRVLFLEQLHYPRNVALLCEGRHGLTSLDRFMAITVYFIVFTARGRGPAQA